MGRVILSTYFGAWLVLWARNYTAIALEDLYELLMNSFVIAAFVGLGLNINAFSVKNYNQQYNTIAQRVAYMRGNVTNISSFFVTPFCVSSASGLAFASDQKNLVYAMFGTDNYLVVMVLGFVFFLVLPFLYVARRYG